MQILKLFAHFTRDLVLKWIPGIRESGVESSGKVGWRSNVNGKRSGVSMWIQWLHQLRALDSAKIPRPGGSRGTEIKSQVLTGKN